MDGTQPKYGRLIPALCLAAGIIYNSWPLGYALDRQVARTGLASDLQRSGHPYYWLFILGDVMAGSLAVAAAWLMMRDRLRPGVGSKPLAAIGLAMFGVFTALCALVPLQHSVAAFTIFRTGDGGFGLDALTNSLAELGILIALGALVFDRRAWQSHPRRTLMAAATSILWVASGVWFVIPAVTGGNAHLAQQALLITTGLAVIVIGSDVSP